MPGRAIHSPEWYDLAAHRRSDEAMASALAESCCSQTGMRVVGVQPRHQHHRNDRPTCVRISGRAARMLLAQDAWADRSGERRHPWASRPPRTRRVRAAFSRAVISSGGRPTIANTFRGYAEPDDVPPQVSPTRSSGRSGPSRDVVRTVGSDHQPIWPSSCPEAAAEADLDGRTSRVARPRDRPSTSPFASSAASARPFACFPASVRSRRSLCSCRSPTGATRWPRSSNLRASTTARSTADRRRRSSSTCPARPPRS